MKNYVKKFYLLTTLVLTISFGIVGCASKGNNAPGASGKAKFPSKNVQFIIPYATGGGTDSLGRLVASELEKAWGKPVLVVNKPGAGSQIGLTEGVKAGKDGYTIGMMTNLDLMTTLIQGENLQYKFEDFEFIAQTNITSNMFVAKPGSQFNSLKEIIDYAKENPGKLTISSSGKDKPPAIIALEALTGAKFSQINYSSGGENLNAILGGHSDLCHIDKNFYSQVTAKNAKVFGVFATDRIPTIKDIPTFKEQGYNVVFDTYRVFFVPKGTPSEVVDTIRDTIVKVTGTDEFKKKLTDLGEVYKLKTGDELLKGLQDDLKSMQQVMSAPAKK